MLPLHGGFLQVRNGLKTQKCNVVHHTPADTVPGDREVHRAVVLSRHCVRTCVVCTISVLALRSIVKVMEATVGTLRRR